jgi:hypothetical protein
LDPCDSGIGLGSDLKKYRKEYFASQIPHSSYVEVLDHMNGVSNHDKMNNKLSYLEKIYKIASICKNDSSKYDGHELNSCFK